MRSALRWFRYAFDIARVFVILKLCKRIDRVESTTSYSDLQSLFLVARDGWGEGSIIEVGAYKGKATVALAWASKTAKREKIISIDPFEPGIQEIFISNIKKLGVEDYVRSIPSSSEEAARSFKGCARFIFIDGCHEYDFVRKDIMLWKDFLITGGVIAFHDYYFPDIRRAANECLIATGEYIVEGAVGMTLFVSKGVSKNKPIFEKIEVFNRLKKALGGKPPEKPYL